jgi:hypothetical protein
MLVWGHPDTNNIWLISADEPIKWSHTEAECKQRLTVQAQEMPKSGALWCVKIALQGPK